VSRPVQPIKPEQPGRETEVRRGLWDEEEEEEDVHPRDVRVVAAISDAELLQWMDGLTDLLRGRLEALDEARALAAEVEDKEQQFPEQQQIIDELCRTKQNIRLRIELDIAQTKLQALRALLRCGPDFRRENNNLRVQLRHVRDVGIGELEREIRNLQTQLESQRDVARQTAAAHMRELFLKVMGAAIQALNKRIAGQTQIATAELKDVVYDVFDQCSNEVIKRIDQRGLL
jgi:hypothetical protein